MCILIFFVFLLPLFRFVLDDTKTKMEERTEKQETQGECVCVLYVGVEQWMRRYVESQLRLGWVSHSFFILSFFFVVLILFWGWRGAFVLMMMMMQ